MGYKCLACTWQNKDSATKCEMCGTARPSAASAAAPPPTSWTCPACTVQNKLLNTKCEVCGAAKPAVICAEREAASVGSRHLGSKEVLLLVDATGSMNLPLKAEGKQSRIEMVRDAARVVTTTYAWDRKRQEGVGMRGVAFNSASSAVDLGHLNAANLVSVFKGMEVSGAAMMVPGWSKIQQLAAAWKQSGTVACQPLVVLCVTDSVPRDFDQLVHEMEAHAKKAATAGAGAVVPLLWSVVLMGEGQEYTIAKSLWQGLCDRFAWVRLHLSGMDDDPTKLGQLLCSIVDSAYVFDQKERAGGKLASAAIASASAKPVAAADGKAPWNCAVCTLSNPGVTMKCSACGQLRGLASAPSADSRPPPQAPGAAGGGGLVMTPTKKPDSASSASSASATPSSLPPPSYAPPASAAHAVPVGGVARATGGQALQVSPTMCFMATAQKPDGTLTATPMYVTLGGADGKTPTSAPMAIPAEMLTPQLLQQLMASMHMQGGVSPTHPVEVQVAQSQQQNGGGGGAAPSAASGGGAVSPAAPPQYGPLEHTPSMDAAPPAYQP